MNSDILIRNMEHEYLHGLSDGLLWAAENLEDKTWTVDDLRCAAQVALTFMGSIMVDWGWLEEIEYGVERKKRQQTKNGTDVSRE